MVRRRLGGEVISVAEYNDRGLHAGDWAAKEASSEALDVATTEPAGDSAGGLCAVIAFEVPAVFVLEFAE